MANDTRKRIRFIILFWLLAIILPRIGYCLPSLNLEMEKRKASKIFFSSLNGISQSQRPAHSFYTGSSTGITHVDQREPFVLGRSGDRPGASHGKLCPGVRPGSFHARSRKLLDSAAESEQGASVVPCGVIYQGRIRNFAVPDLTSMLMSISNTPGAGSNNSSSWIPLT